MKMARARQEEIDRALTLSGMLDDVDDGYLPRNVNGEWAEEEEGVHFDEDNFDHLRLFFDRVTRCGCSFRVTLGYAILSDPRNKVIDPELSHLELHPRLREGQEAVEKPILFWFKRIWKRSVEILKEGWNL